MMSAISFSATAIFIATTIFDKFFGAGYAWWLGIPPAIFYFIAGCMYWGKK